MIPEGWERVQLGKVSDVEKRRWEPGGEPCRYVGLEHIESGARKILEWADSSTIASTKTPFSDQDVLFGKLRPYLKKCAIPGFNGVCSTDILVIKAKDRILPRLLLEVCSSDEFIDFAVKHSGGTRMPRTSWKALQNYILALPNRDEQQKLVAIFGAFEILVQYSQKALAQTRRLKQALLHQLLTKGIDENGKPHTRFKKTEIGEIPEDWEVVELQSTMCKIVDCLHSTPKYEPKGIPAIRTADVIPGKLLLGQAKTVSEETYFSRTGRLVPEAGDIIYTREGERFGIAAPVPNGVKVCLAQRVMHFRAREDYDRRFLLHLLNSRLVYSQALAIASQQTSPHINIGSIRKFKVPIPPLREQRKISQSLDSFIEKEDLIERTLFGIDSIQRQVSSDLLSGRVRVKDLKL